MRKPCMFITAFALLSIFVHGQTKLNPVIKDYGTMFDVPYAKDKPDPTQKYKIIIEAGPVLEKPQEFYAPLEHISRMYNLHVYAGIPQKNLDIELVVFGQSVAVALNNDAYKKKYGVDNPNLKAIEEMRNAGIKIYACGQSINAYEIDPTTINPNVEVALSRFTTVTDRQMKGYAFFKF